MSIDMGKLAELEAINTKLRNGMIAAQRNAAQPGCDQLDAARPNKMVNQPPHYVVTLPNGTTVECVDIVEAVGMTHNVASAFEYIWRSDSKGTQVQDLRKAIWRLQREVDILERDE